MSLRGDADASIGVVPDDWLGRVGTVPCQVPASTSPDVLGQFDIDADGYAAPLSLMSHFNSHWRRQRSRQDRRSSRNGSPIRNWFARLRHAERKAISRRLS